MLFTLPSILQAIKKNTNKLELVGTVETTRKYNFSVQLLQQHDKSQSIDDVIEDTTIITKNNDKMYLFICRIWKFHQRCQQ